MDDFKKGQFFGKAVAGMYTIEFQKRGLPHAHVLLWIERSLSTQPIKLIDGLICAELPNPSRYPILHEIVSKYMIHGPCGIFRVNSPCMNNGKCSKFFSKKIVHETYFDADGFPVYRCRDTGVSMLVRDVQVDNRFVVPYNPKLLMKYRAHMNLEFCNKPSSIKYLFKYVNKGPDHVTVTVTKDNDGTVHNKVEDVDEIKQYYDCIYLSPCESAWRIFAFDIHHRWPLVQRLIFHLPREQSVLFDGGKCLDDIFQENKEKDTMFTAWMTANKKYDEGKNLTYGDFPSHFVYNAVRREWYLHRKGISIGRLNFVPPGSSELFYLRMLLNIQKGCTSFDDIKSVNGVVHKTFHEACYALGLLSDDNEFISAIKEAAELSYGGSLRRLFATLLMTHSISSPSYVWKRTWRLLADDIAYYKRQEIQRQDLSIEDDDLHNLCLFELEKILIMNGKSFKDFGGMPMIQGESLFQMDNVLLLNEFNYPREEMLIEVEKHVPCLNEEQMKIYKVVIEAVQTNCGGFFFVDGYGGTGKTFLWKALSTKLQLDNKVVLNVASSGIVPLLLSGGRTAHSTFAIPLHLTENSICNIKPNSPKGNLIKHASLIIWDEAPMINKWAFEALDRTLKDLMDSIRTEPFGGKVVVLGGDFRQILPVIPNANRADIVMATVNSSVLWRHCKVLTLTQNMRLQDDNSSNDICEFNQFGSWILKIGEGKIGRVVDDYFEVDIPEDLVNVGWVDPIDAIVSSTYPDLLQNVGNHKFFEDRGILAPTIEAVQKVNDHVISLLPGSEKEYLSSDSVCKVDGECGIDEWITVEFLNEIKCSDLPNHKLRLKKGVPVMLLRNIDQATGLCNRTSLIMTDLGSNVICCQIVNGNHLGEKVYIPRMNLIPSDLGIPIKFLRRQFPLSLCFAMTINKSQEQTLSHVGLFLPRPVFSHGQLYVAISRVKS